MLKRSNLFIAILCLGLWGCGQSDFPQIVSPANGTQVSLNTPSQILVELAGGMQDDTVVTFSWGSPLTNGTSGSTTQSRVSDPNQLGYIVQCSPGTRGLSAFCNIQGRSQGSGRGFTNQTFVGVFTATNSQGSDSVLVLFSAQN